MTVYFHLQSNDRIKIGHTNNTIEERRRDLQTGSGHPLVCLGGMSGDRLLERQLHYIFSPYKIYNAGEWYWAVPPIMNFIEKFAESYDDNGGIETVSPIYSPSGMIVLHPARATAIFFLKNLFKLDGAPIMGTELTRRARECGIAKTTLRRALKDLNIEARHAEKLSPTGAAPWYPPQEWPHIPGLEKFNDPNDEDDGVDAARDIE